MWRYEALLCHAKHKLRCMWLVPYRKGTILQLPALCRHRVVSPPCCSEAVGSSELWVHHYTGDMKHTHLDMLDIFSLPSQAHCPKTRLNDA